MTYTAIVPPVSDPVLDFAAEELIRYYEKVTGVLLTYGEKGTVTLTVDSTLDGRLDEYTVAAGPDSLAICGGNSRAVLYGVYAFCQRVLGVRFVSPVYEYIPTRASETLVPVTFGNKALLPTRSFINDESNPYGYGLDALVKLGYNTLPMCASDWANVDEAFKGELEKRGVMLEVSGHDLTSYLPPEEHFAAHPDWFALVNGERSSEQLCFSCDGYIDTLAQRVVDCCGDIPRMDSLTIMFNDNNTMCQCEACRQMGFHNTYMKMLDRLQVRLNEMGVNIKLYHIAYNAALAWDMLDDVPDSALSNCLVALWGRNYAYALPDVVGAQDVRFKDVVERWSALQRRQGLDLHIYEYYGDGWMMGTFLPPLGRVIEKDVPYYLSIGVTGLQTLEFSVRGELDILRFITPDLYDTPQPVHYEVDTLYPIAWHNHYVMGKCMWADAPGYDAILAEYTAGVYGEAAPYAAALLKTAEVALAPLSRFASSMFKLRITDAWLRDEFSAKKTGKIRLRRWAPEHADRERTEEAAHACKLAYDTLRLREDAIAGAEGLLSTLTAGQQKNLQELLRCIRYFIDKNHALALQYRAQLAIEDGRWTEAKACLEEALVLERSYDGMETENCMEWLATCEANL